MGATGPFKVLTICSSDPLTTLSNEPFTLTVPVLKSSLSIAAALKKALDVTPVFALINLDVVIASSAESMFGGGDLKISPLAYQVQQGGDWAKLRAANIILAIESFIQLVGYIGVARGITILNNMSKGKPDASLGKGLTHIVGGVLASNIILTFSILSATFLPTGGSL